MNLTLLIRENRNGILFISLYRNECTIPLEDFICIKQIDISTAFNTININYDCIHKVIFKRI